ncbi:SCP-like protein [Necator americanus]|uniref:SCP-like protein n=1 Tax=Necator americanus TaxID=51031 RepID=W2SKC4_NECAM|nr:SCP-like protein [Necator americanus]ETN69192.1 SCP-like protein [Necator americanus]
MRSQIALGTAPNKNGTCPRGQNVYKLSWDCFLEMQAQNAADQCSENVKGPTGYSQLVQKVRITTCNLAPIPKSTVDGWWSEVKSLANGKATKIGCAQRNCGADLYVVCVVYDRVFTTGGQIYKMGEPCKRCSAVGQAVCKDNLCALN